jgi:hypothetical protein
LAILRKIRTSFLEESRGEKRARDHSSEKAYRGLLTKSPIGLSVYLQNMKDGLRLTVKVVDHHLFSLPDQMDFDHDLSIFFREHLCCACAPFPAQ